MWKWDLVGEVDMDRGDNDGLSDDNVIGDPCLLLLQLQAFPTATINGIISVGASATQRANDCGLKMIHEVVPRL